MAPCMGGWMDGWIDGWMAPCMGEDIFESGQFDDGDDAHLVHWRGHQQIGRTLAGSHELDLDLGQSQVRI